MSEHPVVEFRDVGKMYRMYPSRREGVIDVLGLTRFLPKRRSAFREFWALRGIDLSVKRGQRLGIVGRNGAGKSTLLKLMTGNITPTDGTVEVKGRVQALLEAGGGLHPEFTGHENIYAALTYQGLSPRAIAAQTEDIEEFTELGEFLDQSLKTYSLGMQARLAFAIATTIKPEILIIDEVLGAGDAYFFTKSTQRMAALVEGGATVLLVTHALDQIARFCNDAIWLERGRIVARGAPLDVIKRYEVYIRELEDRRLKAKNLKTQSRRYSAMQQELYADTLVVRVTVEHGSCDVSTVDLVRDGDREDGVSIGDAQDADATQSAFVPSGGGWSSPRSEAGRCFRSLQPDGMAGTLLFHLWALYSESAYEVRLTYRGSAAALLTVEVLVDGEIVSTTTLEGAPDWHTESLAVASGAAQGSPVPGGTGVHGEDSPITGPLGDGAAMAVAERSAPQGDKLVRWPGLGSLQIERVLLLDEHDREQAVFATLSPMKLELTFRAMRSGTFPIILTAVFFRVDGIRVFTHIGVRCDRTLEEDERCTAVLDLGLLNLGDGRYVTTVALYEELSVTGASPFYDLLDRSYEFEVIGNPPFAGVFQHPGTWHFE